MTQVQPTQKVYGAWQQIPVTPSRQMTVDAQQMAAHWRRCSLSSDFWAQYMSLFIPTRVTEEYLGRGEVEQVLAYLLNELFENCAKFSNGSHQLVRYVAWSQDDSMLFQVTNHILPEGQAPFAKLIDEMLNNDPHELYFQRLEENVELDLDGSGLGYLTLIKDFGVQFSFRFRPQENGSTAVDVQAKVSLQQE